MAKSTKLIINVPDALLKAQDLLLRTPSIEDGSSGDALQGKIYTSELSADDKYSVNYTSPITQVDFQNVKTGNFYIVNIHCSYLAQQASISATNPGLYGSELIKAGEPFTIACTTSDYIRGIVVEIVNIVPTLIQSSYPEIWQYNFELQCMIAQGNPKEITPGQLIIWKRQRYQDPSTFNDATPPINLTASFNSTTKEIFFFWDDVNQSSRYYTVQLRDTFNSNNPYIYKLKVHGPLSNTDTSLRAFVNNGDVKTIQIIEPGLGLNSNRSLVIKGTGTGAIWATRLDNEGALMINEFEVTGGSGATLNLFSRKTKKEYNGYPVPTVNSFVEGLPSLGTTTNFYISSVSGSGRSISINLLDADTGLPTVITPAWLTNVVGSEIKTHDGVYKIQTGSGYNYRTLVSVKTIPNGVRAYWDPVFGEPTNSAPFGYSTTKIWAWSVSATYDEINKLYTEWTEEEYINLA